MRVAITGCAGFIGSHAVDYFLAKGCFVVGIDSLTYAGNLDNIQMASQNKNFKFVKMDICETDDITQMCKSLNVQWIINFAAETHVDNSIACDSKFIHSNIVGVSSLLKTCRELSVPLFHISTDEVYGPALGNTSFNEGDTLNPLNPYSATKAAAEHLIKAFHNTYKTNYIIVRPSNNFGPRQHKEKFLPTIIKNLQNNEKIPVYGDGTNIRDWLYVKDNVEIMYNILVRSKLNETYNITSKKEMTNLEMIKNVTKIMQVDMNERVKFVKDRPGHDFRYSVSDEKIRKLGVVEENDFYENLKATVISFGGNK